MRFWDSSAIVPLLVHEPTSRRLLALLQEDPRMIAWWGASVECVSAIARLERETAIAATAVDTAIERLRSLRCTWHEVQPSQVVRETAERLLRVHALRAADSLQLAAAVLAANHRPVSLALVCSDERLSVAAHREGFAVLRV